MSATRYLGDRTRIVVTWVPRREWDTAWNQGSYELVFYDAKQTREILPAALSAVKFWQAPHRAPQPPRKTTRRSLDLNIFVDRGARGDGDRRQLTSPSLRGMDVTLEELGFVRPKMPTRPDHRGNPAICEVYDLGNMGCQSHEDCRKNRELSFACGAEQIKWIRAEDAAREKLLGSPLAIDAIVRLVLSKIANSSQEQLGRDWFDTESVRDDLAKYGVLAVRRTPEKSKGRSTGVAPLQVFHGTRHASRILQDGFTPSATGEFGPGIYFSTFEPTAAFYAKRVASGPEAPTVLRCEVSLRKAFHTTKADYLKLTERSTPRAVQARLVRQGYDGIVGVGLNGVDVQVVAFYPAQIRACVRV